MERDVIAYAQFNNSEEFEAWQKAFEEPIKIISLTPIFIQGGVLGNENHWNSEFEGTSNSTLELNTSYALFITYWKEVK